jgi:diguanylate cyclase (GGDEF)-like protein
MRHFPSAGSAETMLDTLVDAMHLVDTGIILLNRDLRVRYANRRQTELFELSPALLASGPHFRDLLARAGAKSWFAVPPDRLADYLNQREKAVLAGSFGPTRLDMADGRRLLVSCLACPDGGRILTYADISHELRREAEYSRDAMRAELRFRTETLDNQGAYLVSLAEAADESARKGEVARIELQNEVTERRHLETELRRLATTDGLTGMLNRSAFLAAGELGMERARRFGHSLAVLMLDVDHFKTINDRLGHAGGDLALQHLAATLGDCIRTVDVLGRLGGEEFGIVLPSASLAMAEQVAERLRSRVEASRPAFGDKIIKMTISVGLSMRLETDRGIEQMVARADAALYRAKGAGRNQVAKDLLAVAA